MPDSKQRLAKMHAPEWSRQREGLFTPAEMAAADRRAPELGMSGLALMRRASWAVAQAALRFGPCRTVVVCGAGGNGGDGWGAAALLARRGWPVAVATLGAPPPGSDAAVLRAEWGGPIVPLIAAETARAELVIDAVFGAGLSRDVPETVADALAAAAHVLAVDVPTGVDGATGQQRGRVRAADLTVTFVARKPGHLLLPGRELCGTLICADIGMPAAALPPVQAWRNTPALWTVPQPGSDTHKYTRGHVTVLGGAEMTGAARLAAGAARHGGAGLVTIASPLAAANVYRGGDPGLIVLDDPLARLLEDERRHVWVCGPGLSPDAAGAALPALVAARRQVVADADALGWAACDPARLRGVAVITPHAGEFAKLFGPIGPDKIGAARTAASQIGATVVLKGSDTVIAAPDGRAAINDTATPWLATAGAGDVLAGLVASMLAQGMEAWEGACAAVWLHGYAAQLAGPGLVAEDIAPHVAAAMKALNAPSSYGRQLRIV